MIQDRQDINGRKYQYDPDSGAVFYGEADADDFTFQNGVTYLSRCGCRADTGCQCRQKIAPLDKPTKTPLSWVRAGVERVRREMAAEQAERQAELTRRRIRNQIARDHRYAVEHPAPQPYDLALAKRGIVPEVWQSDGGCPEPYSIALGGEIPLRRADGTPVRLPEGGDPPQPYTLALEAKRQAERKANGD